MVISSDPSKEMPILVTFAVMAAVSDHNIIKENNHVVESVLYSADSVDSLIGLECLSNCLSIQDIQEVVTDCLSAIKMCHNYWHSL